MYMTLGESIQHGFAGGTITFEALIWAKAIKLLFQRFF
jgi:hypothetical protein